ncbi:E3 ubiquitin-protein ligase TRIM11-like [Trichosurus vulpecula]|uniref:E3 ubiquitin-protein ligase TRIM11-like n=1 Tax=Trichosurus vulpecula TaxID=9337 RepID=UPI00186B275B|nr:E3 ubiquitin-protein ligase TRIM11-like [Trichosurus vulpecula]
MAFSPELIHDLQEELICSLCRKYFTDPISIDCGHSFCHCCLLDGWQEAASTSFSCPECENVSQLKDFKTNIHLEKLVCVAKKLRLHCSQYPEGPGKCEAHQEEQKLFCEDDQSLVCVSCSQSQEHEAHKLCGIDEAAENFRGTLQETLILLWRKTDSVVKQRSNEKIKFVRLEDMKGILTRNESVLQKEIETFHVGTMLYSMPGIIDRIVSFKVDITLDCNTADPGLIISEDFKSVRYGGVQEVVPNNRRRLVDFAEVLATQSFISTRCYWEVEVPNNTAWCVGIRTNSKDFHNFFMLMTVQKHNCYLIYAMAQNNLNSQIHKKYRQISVPNLKVGIFLDYECGEISFYHVKSRYLIYTFPTTSFSGPLTPFFCLSKKVLTNDCSLVICP